MKTSITNKFVNRVLKIVGAKNLYEKDDFLTKQAKINQKPVHPPVTSAKLWVKHYFENSCYFYSKSSSNTSKQIIVYFHGGAFVSNPNIMHWTYLKKIKKATKLPIYFPIYPKPPTFNHTHAYNFLFDFFNLILKKHKNASFIFMGDSAGGNIALSFALQLKQKNMQVPNKIIVFSPCLDLTLSNSKINQIEKQNLDPLLTKKGLAKMYKQWSKPETNLSHWILSPINGSLKHFSNVLLFAGTHEVLHPEAYEFFQKLKQNKINVVFVEKQQLLHAWPLHPIKEAKPALKVVKEFIFTDC